MFDGSVARESLRLWALWTKRRAVAHGVGAGQKAPLSTGSVQEEVTVFICYFENRKYNRRPSEARANGHWEESHHGGVLQLTPVERIPGPQSKRPLGPKVSADSAGGSRASLRKAASLAEALERRSLRELNQTEPIGSDMSSPQEPWCRTRRSHRQTDGPLLSWPWLRWPAVWPPPPSRRDPHLTCLCDSTHCHP